MGSESALPKLNTLVWLILCHSKSHTAHRIFAIHVSVIIPTDILSRNERNNHTLPTIWYMLLQLVLLLLLLQLYRIAGLKSACRVPNLSNPANDTDTESYS